MQTTAKKTMKKIIVKKTTDKMKKMITGQRREKKGD